MMLSDFILNYLVLTVWPNYKFIFDYHWYLNNLKQFGYELKVYLRFY